MPYRQRLSTKAKLRRLGYIFFFALIAGVLVFIVYSIIDPGTGPRGPVGTERTELTREERNRLLEESRELEARFNAMVAEGEEPGAEAVEIFLEAYEKHRRATVNNPFATFEDQQRLDRMREYAVEYEGDFLAGRIDELEGRAEERRDEGDYEAGIALLREALGLQERINREMRQSPHSSATQAASLERRIVNWQAEPIIERSRTAEREAREAVSEERWSDALDLFAEAREGQVRINADFQRTPFVNRSRVGEIEAEIASLRTSEVRAEIANLADEGTDLLEREQYEAAADRFAEAVERQRFLNREFAGSQYASSAALRELEGLRQTALSGEWVKGLRDSIASMDRSLRDRRIDNAREHLADAGRTLRRLEDEFPLSDYGDEETGLRIGYLHSIRDRLEAVHEAVYAHLRELPGNGISLYALEVPQSLYTRIMNRNPSRREGASLPVDSVNWDEANEFCRRLSWVLGHTVRLPTREEFVRAAGDLDGPDISAIGWHLRNSDGISREVGILEPNEHGFYDLLGNVAEWLATTGGDGRGLVAGGSYNDDLQDVTAVPVEPVGINQRSRTVGFRFVVETDG